MRDDRLVEIEWDAMASTDSVSLPAEEVIELARLAQRTRAAENEAAWLREPF